jgi:hypothetical protein
VLLAGTDPHDLFARAGRKSGKEKGSGVFVSSRIPRGILLGPSPKRENTPDPFFVLFRAAGRQGRCAVIGVRGRSR